MSDALRAQLAFASEQYNTAIETIRLDIERIRREERRLNMHARRENELGVWSQSPSAHGSVSHVW